MLSLLDLLPNLPNEGLPTPRGWGQTWDSMKEEEAIPLVALTSTFGLIGAAVGVGVGLTVAATPGGAIPIAFGILGASTTTGATVYGIGKKIFEEKEK